MSSLLQSLSKIRRCSYIPRSDATGTAGHCRTLPFRLPFGSICVDSEDDACRRTLTTSVGRVTWPLQSPRRTKTHRLAMHKLQDRSEEQQREIAGRAVSAIVAPRAEATNRAKVSLMTLQNADRSSEPLFASTGQVLS